MPVFVDEAPNVFGALAFGMPHQGTINFLENRLHQTSEYLHETGREFMARGMEVFNKYAGAEALRFAKAAIRAVQHAFDPNSVHFLGDIGAIQQAPLSMQRWIMAMPEVRTLYHQQRCDGYSDTYVDYHPGQIGSDHYDWRRVMSGVVMETPNNPDYEWECTTYMEGEEAEDDVNLSLSEKVDILSTWDIVRNLLNSGKEDPTSIYCDKL